MIDRFGYVRLPRTTAISFVGFAIFILLTILVHARLLAGVDLATTLAVQRVTGAPLDALSTALSILFSGEVSLLMAVLMSWFLWRRKCGVWSLAPLALLPLVGIELGMKMIVQQPVVPADLQRSIYYPLTNVDLSGSFPSGHQARATFLCTFLAVLISRRRGTATWLALCGLAVLVAVVGYTRIYLGDHWLSDVVAGLIFGASLAFLIAPPVARRLSLP